jgi:hypothetical protein
VDVVQPDKLAVRTGHKGGSHVGAAPGTSGISAGVGRSLLLMSRAGRMTWETIQGGFREVSTAKHGQNCRSSLQAPLLSEREGFVCPTNQKANTINLRLLPRLRVSNCSSRCPIYVM